MSQAANPYAAPAAPLTLGHKRCDSCGAEILVRAEICPKCGVRQRNAVSKPVLLLLTFFTGGLGGHKFYLKKPWQGVLYLLFFWTYIPALVALVELVIYACTSSERLNEKYSAAGGGVVIAIIVAVFFGIFMLGILAAIAIPAYQDYTHRARATNLMISALPWREAVAQHYAETRRLPSSVAELGRNTPPDGGASQHGSIALGTDGVLTLSMSAQSSVNGKTVVLRPTPAGDVLQWDCKGGTLEPRNRPAGCRP